MSNYRCVDCGSHNVVSAVEKKDVNKHKGGRSPYGFYVLNGEYNFEPFITGPILADIMRTHASGASYRSLANCLNRSDVKSPSGGEWTHASVRRVVEQGKRLSHLIPLSEVLG